MKNSKKMTLILASIIISNNIVYATQLNNDYGYVDYIELQGNDVIQDKGAYSKDRLYTFDKNEKYYYLDLNSKDDNGMVGNINNYFSLSPDGTELTVKEITITNQGDYIGTAWLHPQIIYQKPNVNGGFSESYAKPDLFSYRTLHIPPGETKTFEEVTYSLKGVTDDKGNQMKFILDDRASLSLTFQLGNNEGKHLGYEYVDIQNNTDIKVRTYFEEINELAFVLREKHFSEDGHLITTSAWDRGKLTLKHNDTGTTYVEEDYYTFDGESTKFYDMPKGEYTWTYENSNGKSIPYENYIELPAMTGTFNYKTNLMHYYVEKNNNKYSEIESNLFYDFDRDGIQDSNEPTINDSAERKKIKVEPFIKGGSTDKMFHEKENFTVKHPGQVYAEYVGDKYNAVKVQSGVEVTIGDIAHSKTVQVPAPVYVYANVNGKIFYDIDRDNKYTAGIDKYANGTVKINGTNYAVTNGTFNIPKLESGEYTYTFNSEDGVNIPIKTGVLTVAPSGTPNAQGIINTSINVPIDIQEKVSVQVYSDNDYTNTRTEGDTITNKKVNISGPMNGTNNNVFNFWKTGLYNITSIIGLGADDRYDDKLSFNITRNNLIDSNDLELEVGYKPPAKINGYVINQWGNYVDDVTFKYNGRTSDTNNEGYFNLTVPYTDQNNEYTLSNPDYETKKGTMSVKPNNNMGTITLNKIFYTISGKITNEDGYPTSGAVVEINEKSVITDNNGNYKMDINIEDYEKINNVKVTHNDYLVYEENLNRTPKEFNEINITLKQPKLNVESNVKDYDIFIETLDGESVVNEYVEYTNYSIKLKPMKYEVTVAKEDYNTETEVIDLTKDLILDIDLYVTTENPIIDTDADPENPISPQRIYLKVNSNVEDYDLTLEHIEDMYVVEKYVESKIEEIRLPKQGEYKVTAEKEDYDTVEKVVNVDSASGSSVDIDLYVTNENPTIDIDADPENPISPQRIYLTVNSNIEDYDLTLEHIQDGYLVNRYMYSKIQDVRVPKQGEYKVIAKKDGYDTVEEKVNINTTTGSSVDLNLYVTDEAPILEIDPISPIVTPKRILTLNSNVSDFDLYLKNKNTGYEIRETIDNYNVELPILYSGVYDMVITKEGYNTIEEEIDLTNSNTYDVELYVTTEVPILDIDPNDPTNPIVAPKRILTINSNVDNYYIKLIHQDMDYEISQLIDSKKVELPILYSGMYDVIATKKGYYTFYDEIELMKSNKYHLNMDKKGNNDRDKDKDKDKDAQLNKSDENNDIVGTAEDKEVASKKLFVPKNSEFLLVANDDGIVKLDTYTKNYVDEETDTMYVSLRSLVELNSKYTPILWDNETKEVTILLDDNALVLKNNSSEYLMNDEVKLLKNDRGQDLKIKSMNNRIVVPLRNIGEALGYEVKFDYINNSAVIIND